MANMGGLVDLVASIMRVPGYQVVIVTSAAVGFGCLKLNLANRPRSDQLSLKQAVAAAGQSLLIRLYEDLFDAYGLKVAQILLSRSDFSAKDRFRNFRNATNELLNMGVIPIINENDCICVDELRFGDNDTLSALVAVSCNAERLFLLTDVDCLYDKNPHEFADAKPIRELSSLELAKLDVEVGGDSQWGTGGMATKLVAARTAVAAGIECILTHGAKPNKVLEYLRDGSSKGLMTVFKVAPDGMQFAVSKMTWRRRWMLGLETRGVISLDKGAAEAIRRKKSLFAAGITRVTGSFHRDDCVSLVEAETGEEIARGVVNLRDFEVEKIRGHKSSEYGELLGCVVAPEVAYRENIILTTGALAVFDSEAEDSDQPNNF
ncbi:Glutamate 5-kinase, putative [Perkinsus marinus ATCC 50983]|uniref:Glutamate 5-kinase, putative n=1 Tax=Perkinsus marinus (strain ATCC 50983 / TXsc) TaxID=423536 RepID=C5KVA1_PERM5|nr:Glutamate 5-kinase, putative [Perkinsus marinus ATCC 50983]EER11647.1 Glutamate 5-kinase, putative [Perkinsus marinus ATCC 50983]|eukprot:XP_002779852.1 Glutamate 5-kinase, putative [Perkinsus marinus ATCC 50983]